MHFARADRGVGNAGVVLVWGRVPLFVYTHTIHLSCPSLRKWSHGHKPSANASFGLFGCLQACGRSCLGNGPCDAMVRSSSDVERR